MNLREHLMGYEGLLTGEYTSDSVVEQSSSADVMKNTGLN